jgi:hypothetical protein
LATIISCFMSPIPQTFCPRLSFSTHDSLRKLLWISSTNPTEPDTALVLSHTATFISATRSGSPLLKPSTHSRHAHPLYTTIMRIMYRNTDFDSAAVIEHRALVPPLAIIKYWYLLSIWQNPPPSQNGHTQLLSIKFVPYHHDLGVSGWFTWE